MNARRAFKLGVRAEDVRVRCWAHKYNERWVVWYGGRPITEGGVYEMCQFRATLARLAVEA